MGNLGICVVLTILVIVFTFSLINLSQYIVDVFNKRLKPWVLSLNDENAIVPLEYLKSLKLELRDLREKYDKEVNERIKYQDQYRELKDKEIEHSIPGGFIEKDSKPDAGKDKDNSQHVSEALEVFDRIENTKNAPHLVSQANGVLLDLLKGKPVKDHPLINDFLKYNLVKHDPQHNVYRITEIGKAFFYQVDKQKSRFNLS